MGAAIGGAVKAVGTALGAIAGLVTALLGAVTSLVGLSPPLLPGRRPPRHSPCTPRRVNSTFLRLPSTPCTPTTLARRPPLPPLRPPSCGVRVERMPETQVGDAWLCFVSVSPCRTRT
jgi:hypothetical protein